MTAPTRPAPQERVAANPSIIADRGGRVWLAVAAVAAALGTVAAVHYWHLDLTSSHYDAKGHLVVARRILDSLNPGWVQIGAVWLPLPHLLNALPVQIDVLYRTGWSAVAMSIAAYGLTAGLLFRIIAETTGSRLAAGIGTLVFLLSPDVLYLQATPMTEPLLMALATGAVWACGRAFAAPSRRTVRTAGLLVAAACLTRYEAWPITAALFGLAALGLRHGGWGHREVLGRIWPVAVYPAVAIAAFLVLGRASTGSWFTTSGFFVPENVATGRPLKAVLSVWWGAHQLTSYALASLALAGLVLGLWQALRQRRALTILPLALVAAGALPAYAFYTGHPFRIRYMVPLVPVVGLGVGLLVGAARGRRWRLAVASVSLVALVTAFEPFDRHAPMVAEAQWDTPNRQARRAVTTHLVAQWDGELVLASMGSLAHYMQELSAAGFDLADFIHEGNGEIWDAASEHPGRHVSWVLVEERAEGGDVLAQRASARPQFLADFERVAEGGGVALFRRSPVRTGP